MNKYIKSFLHRGLVFGGFGPIVIGIIYCVLELSVTDFSVRGTQICLAIVSSYLLAYIHAGASVFNQIEEWSLLKSTFCHFLTLYLAYIICYMLNSWIPFKIEVLLIFTSIFALGYLAVWICVVTSIKLISKKMNKKLFDMEK